MLDPGELPGDILDPARLADRVLVAAWHGQGLEFFRGLFLDAGGHLYQRYRRGHGGQELLFQAAW